LRKQFGDGEQYYCVEMEDRSSLVGKDVVMVASTHKDDDLLELVRVGYALAHYGTRKRIFCIPFLGYSTMERAVNPGEVSPSPSVQHSNITRITQQIVTAKVNANLLSSIPNSGCGNTFLMMDLHVSGIMHYFEGNCSCAELYAEEVLESAIASLKLDSFVMGTADLGRTLWVSTFASHFHTGIVFVKKTRHFETTSVEEVIGDPSGKTVVIYDDMTRSGSTLFNAADAYLERGAKEVYAVLSHFALNNEGIIDKIQKSNLKKVIATNTHPMSQSPALKNADKIEIVDASQVFATRIISILERDF